MRKTNSKYVRRMCNILIEQHNLGDHYELVSNNDKKLSIAQDFELRQDVIQIDNLYLKQDMVTKDPRFRKINHYKKLKKYYHNYGQEDFINKYFNWLRYNTAKLLILFPKDKYPQLYKK